MKHGMLRSEPASEYPPNRPTAADGVIRDIDSVGGLVHADVSTEGLDHIDSPAPKESENVATLYKAYSRQLSAALRKMFGDGPPDPDDIAQLAFQKIIERGDVSSIHNLKAFIWRTARNLVLKEKRAEDVRSRYDFEIEQLFFPLKGDDSTPERVLSAREQLKAINRVLRRMPEKRRRALILHRMDGLSVAAVARRLGISRTAAAKHVARGAAEIDALLAEEGKR